jgi:hypothetical protein
MKKLSDLSIAELEAIGRLLAKEIYLTPCKAMTKRDAKIAAVKAEINRRLGEIDFEA